MRKTKCKERMLINSYLFSLVLFGTILLGGVYVWLGTMMYQSVLSGIDTVSNTLAIASFFLLLLLGLFIACMMESYDMFGVVSFYEDELIIRAPFRKTICLPYDDIRHIQIDYHMLAGSAQFWVILGKEPMPGKLRHQAVKLRFSEQMVRIPYCKKTDQFLTHRLTGDLYKQYSKAKSTLRAHKHSFDES